VAKIPRQTDKIKAVEVHIGGQVKMAKIRDRAVCIEVTLKNNDGHVVDVDG
jgi:hypothetical protein